MKHPENIPDFTTGEPHFVSAEVAIYLVKRRASCVRVWSDFGWVSVYKYIMLDFLEALGEGQIVRGRKVPKFSTYSFRLE